VWHRKGLDGGRERGRALQIVAQRIDKLHTPNLTAKLAYALKNFRLTGYAERRSGDVEGTGS